MNALEKILYALDTPGAYTRGALAGRIGERASGEDVLRNFGVDDPNKWAGIGAEMLLDPLNLIPGGMGLKALRGAKKATKANKAAKIMIKKGAMPADVAEKTLARHIVRPPQISGNALELKLQGIKQGGHRVTPKHPEISQAIRPRSPMVEADFPISALDDKYIQYLKETTDPAVVKKYAGETVDAPVDIYTNKKGKLMANDGGHRIVAAVARGDKTFKAMVDVPTYDKVVGKGKGAPVLLKHGTKTTYDKVDPRFYDPNALKGPGNYNTESGKVSSGYSKTKASSGGSSRHKTPATDEEIARFFRPGTKLGRGEAPVVRGLTEAGTPLEALRDHSIITKYDPVARKVHVQDYDKAGKAIGKERDYSNLTFTKREYLEKFEPDPDQVRIGFMDSRKVLDLDATTDMETISDLADGVEEMGFEAVADGMREIHMPDFGGSYTNDHLYRDTIDDITREVVVGFEDYSAKGHRQAEESAKAMFSEIIKQAGFDTITHTGGAAKGLEHKVHIGLMGADQMYLPHVAPAIQKVRKPRIGLRAAGTAAYQGGTKIGLRR